ncbi:MAG: aspartate aminotransferase family protein [Eubacterium sp.]|nr:aspartate aminotransferase family protein [Eubacterium sp.]
MAKQFCLTPVDVPEVETKNRRICTSIPHRDAVKIIEELREYEPISMSGQPPVVWDKAVGYNVYDRWGNKWIDFSSCVLVANTGHCNPNVQKAVSDMVDHQLLNNYCFPSEIRAKLVKKISEFAPEGLDKVFLLSTGSESTECAIKLARTYGQKVGGKKKIKIVTFDDAFHGRTMGSQMAGGTPAGKTWIVNVDKDFHNVPFPNSFKYEWADPAHPDYSDEKCFEAIMKPLVEQGVDFDEISGIMTETFQGGWAELISVGVARILRDFCDKHNIVLIFDEVQAAFGRTGKRFGFEHMEIVPDLVCCGKGISSSLPLSCVIGKKEIMDIYGPNQMTSTHTGNPLSCAATLASIDYLLEHDLISHVSGMESVCRDKLEQIRKKYKDVVGFVKGVGLVWAIVFTKSGTKEIDPDLAHDVVESAMRKGVLFFAPVGTGATLKVSPPLVIDKEALLEGLSVLDEAIGEALANHD